MCADTAGVVLVAPLDGWCAPLEEAPDPVFAGRMLGDGVAIDPTSSTVHAPCDGDIIALPDSRHAVTLRATGGAEILIHVGIDTVALAGAGFESLVRVGDRVRVGTPLLRFDLDAVALHAPSLITPVIVISEGYAVEAQATGRSVRVGDPLFRVVRSVLATGVGDEKKSTETGTGAVTATADARRVVNTANTPPALSIRRVVVGLPHGLHARPAARIAQLARSGHGDIRLVGNQRDADARSVTSLMTLGVHAADEVALQWTRPESMPAVAAIEDILRDDGDKGAVEATPGRPSRGAIRESQPGVRGQGPDDNSVPNLLRGVIASRGLALGPVHHLRTATFTVPEDGLGPARESAALAQALHDVHRKLAQDASTADAAQRDVAAAHAALLDDPELALLAERAIQSGRSAGHAWRTAIRHQAAILEELDDAYLRERTADLRDLEARVLTALGLGLEASAVSSMPVNAIVVAREILPSQFAALDPTRVAGVCTSGGGATSHVAILASSVGLPMLVAVGAAVDALHDGEVVLLDANAGLLHAKPGAAQQADAARRIANDHERRELERAAAQGPACTADGHRIQVFANLGSVADAVQAVALGADGCGLLRSEFLFLDRHTAPSEDEQRRVYQDIATRLEGRPLTIRTLDVGGDKPLDYLPMPAEDNPALGLRGVRTSLFRRDLLREQLRAVLRVTPQQQCRVLLPMVTDVDEVDAVRAELQAAMAELGVESAPPLGVMIETPAAAVLADTLARRVDFLSVGTNDLTQYTLAMDRTHPQLAPRLDGLHPAVLRLIAAVCDAGRRHVREVAVCGGLATDLTAIPVLLGLGVDELSVAHAAVPAVKARIAQLEVEACRALAQRALGLATATEVRALMPGNTQP